MSTALAAARAKTKGKRMLRNALDAYGEEDTTLSKWNARKKQAVEEGKWVWKEGVVNAGAAIKARFDMEEVQSTLKTRFVDVQTAMEEEMSSAVHLDQHGGQLFGPGDLHEDQCCWRERIGGKMYHCTNMLPPVKKKTAEASRQDSAPAPAPATKRFCLWHSKECVHPEHPMESSRVVEIPNECGLCLHCYEATAGTRGTLQKTPPRLGVLKAPGVSATNTRKQVKRDAMFKLRGKSTAERQAGPNLGLTSLCAWQKEHSEISYVWRCSNRVLMHPELRGSFLPFCGFHSPRCIHEYGNKGKREQACLALERKNRYGMCRNHLEAHLSSLSLEERQRVLLIDSDFDVPGIKECKREEAVAPVVRHPLAPKHPPPAPAASSGPSFSMETTSAVAVLPSRPRRTPLEKFIKNALVVADRVVREVLDHPNPVSAVVKDVLWRVQFLRRAEVVATRIQRMFRGNRARRRVRLLLYEQAALDRMEACRVLQRFVRGFLGRRRFEHEHEDVHRAVPHIQRLLRGALARKRFRELFAALRLQRNYRLYRQRLLALAFREEIAYMRALQRQADANLTEMERQMLTFRRLRARRVLRASIMRWKRRQERHEQEVAERLRSLLGTVKIQRQWRRYHRYMLLKRRYGSAQLVQKRVRGWLTRRMWLGDPGIHFVASFVSARSGFQYGKTVVDAQPSKSYSFPSRKIRTRCGALAIQRVYRGHRGRLAANERWAGMLRRWEWLGITPTDSSGQLSDCMTVGHQRYAFVLPSFAYHEDRRQHMRPIANEPVPTRGHAYKYQYMLDLISDRDGKRGWSLAREELYARQLREEQEWLRAEEARRDAKDAEVAAKALRKHISSIRDPLAQSMPVSKALFPVGSAVDVVGKMEGQRVVRRGKVLAIHREKGPNGERAASFDVEYAEALRNSFGRLEEGGELRVSAARLRHPLLVSPETSSDEGVGVLIQAAIDGLRHEIRTSRLPKDADQATEKGARATEQTLTSVDAIADRLRDCREGHNLLHDQRDFVSFVFQNASLLQLKWLQVVSHVRYGTSSTTPQAQATHSGVPSASLMELFHRELGADGSPRKSEQELLPPMPARAEAIEARMAKLGFRRDSKAAAYADDNSLEEDEAVDSSARPETTPAGGYQGPRSDTVDTVDDMMLFRDDPTPQHAQDVHRLIYELKTLPREARRELIIHVSSRRAQAFVCGHPACGKCFSSRKMARLHQSTTHEGRERLASANPLVDQYLHSYWPQGTPWSDADTRRMVGYVGCSHEGCAKLQFRTRRELHRHCEHAHGMTGDSSSSSSSATRSPLPALEEDTGSRKRPTLVRRAIWLGSYVVCRDLEAKLGVPAAALVSPKACAAHDKPVQLCTACFLQQRRPNAPFRIYSAVAVRRAQAGSRIEASAPAEEEEYMIFRDDDDTFCPAVNIWGVYSLSTPPRRRGKEQVLLPDPLSSVLYIKIATVCRDADGEAWIFGYALAHRKQLGARDTTDEHEVVPDKARGLVFALLSQVVGSASIHHCSKRLFYRKYHSGAGSSDQDSANTLSSSADNRGNGAVLARTLFCRLSHPARVLED